MEGELGPFPNDIFDEIRRLPGNDKCCDCYSLDTDWGSVNHGALICLECAGKHRGLGVSVSFVRSIHMDTWNRQQVEQMRQGGNDQIRDFFRKLEIHNSPISTLYNTKGASHYRDRLKDRVDRVLRGEIPAQRVTKAIAPSKAKSDSSIASDCNKFVAAKLKDTIEYYSCKFLEGPMGMTIMKDFKGCAVITKLVPGGAANIHGVRIGDLIVGVAGKMMDDYDEIMHMIPCMGRPLQLTFSRVVPVAITTTSPLQQIVTSNVANTNNLIVNKSNKQENSDYSRKKFDDDDRAIDNAIGESNYNDSRIGEVIGYKDDDKDEKDSGDESDGDGEGRVEGEVKITLSSGDLIKVTRKGKLRSAVVIREHSDGTYKVSFRDGSIESHVVLERIKLSEELLNEKHKQFHALTVANNNIIYDFQNKASIPETPIPACAADNDEEFVVKTSDSIDLDDWINDDSAIEAVNISATSNNYEYSVISAATPVGSDYVSLDESHKVTNDLDYRVIFTAPPLGMTIAKNFSGNAEVTKVISNGQADKLDVILGDLLIAIGNDNIHGYEEAMSILPEASYPLALVFRKGIRHTISNTGEAIVKGSSFMAQAVMDGLGMKKEKSILSTPTERKLANKTLILSNGKDNNNVGSSGSKMTTKRQLDSSPESSIDILDVTFSDGDLGARFEEKPGPIPLSVVTSVTDDGQAKLKGVKVGCIIVGVNGEKFISHAHTVATLKHCKRPVAVRFKFPPKF